MPILIFALVFLAVLVLVVALIPVSMVKRYRAGTRRQLARGWLTTLNVGAFALSTALFVAAAAVTGIWVPRALAYTLAGLAVGAVLGLVGLWLTRWETTPDTLHYTPNRWLVLAILLTVGGRLVYGAWRAWDTWRWVGDGDASWLVSSGAPTALAAGAVVLGYYLTYWSGVRRRFYRYRGPTRRTHRAPPAIRVTPSRERYDKASPRRSLLRRR